MSFISQIYYKSKAIINPVLEVIMNVEIDIISRITEMYPKLREAEKSVAKVIVDDLTFASSASITELAEQAQVSEASVTRFAKTMGCKNVRDLKLRIVKCLAVGQRFIYEKPDETGIQGIYQSAQNVIQKNRDAITPEVLNKACDIVNNSRQIVIVGMGGGSTVLSQELQFRLFRLGYVVSSYNDGLLTRMAASTIDEKDVFIALSLTGYTAEIAESAEIAKQYGAKVIAITQTGSPLSEISDLTLPIITEESDYIYKPSSSRYAMMVTLDILAYRLASTNKPKVRDKLRRLKITLDNHRDGSGSRQPLGD
ncbi:transcriptional regulator [Vibrio sp. MACH09]|nr:transcriptional regulator [Vibrio sp. MACH09]